jgi:hypothetical protein
MLESFELALPGEFSAHHGLRRDLLGNAPWSLHRLHAWLSPWSGPDKRTRSREASTDHVTERATRSGSLVTCMAPRCRPLFNAFQVSAIPHLQASRLRMVPPRASGRWVTRICTLVGPW